MWGLLCLGKAHIKEWCWICGLFTKWTQVVRDLHLKQHFSTMQPASVLRPSSDQRFPSGSESAAALHPGAGASLKKQSCSPSNAPRKRLHKTDRSYSKSHGDLCLSSTRSVDQHGMNTGAQDGAGTINCSPVLCKEVRGPVLLTLVLAPWCPLTLILTRAMPALAVFCTSGVSGNNGPPLLSCPNLALGPGLCQGYVFHSHVCWVGC